MSDQKTNNDELIKPNYSKPEIVRVPTPYVAAQCVTFGDGDECDPVDQT